MELTKIILPLTCGLSPFAIGWIALSLVVGLRGGREAGIRLFLLGGGLLGTLGAIVVVLIFLPAWVAVTLFLVVAFWPWAMTLRFFITASFSGELVQALPTASEKWQISIISGMILVILALSQLLFPNRFLAPLKAYALGTSLLSVGIYRMVRRIRHAQIREKGILSESGNLYRWENIASYIWKFGEDKLVLKLKKAQFRQVVNLKLLSRYRSEVVAQLSQKIPHLEKNSPGYTIQKAAYR